MINTTKQAIEDLAGTIYLVCLHLFLDQKYDMSKVDFLIECLKLISNVKLIDCCIFHYNQTITYEIGNDKYSFWIVEIPNIEEKYEFINYLSGEFSKIFYSYKIDFD